MARTILKKLRLIEAVASGGAAVLALVAAACSGRLDVKEAESDAGAGGTTGTIGGDGGSAGTDATTTSGATTGDATTGDASTSDASTTSATTAGGVGGSGAGGATSSVNTTSTASTAGGAPSCLNAVVDGSETDIDCGGPECAPCPVGGRCEEAADCESQACDDQFCRGASCDDGVKNGEEMDIDCGGPECADCPEICDCAVSDRLSVLNCGSTTVQGTGWPTPGLLSADGSVSVFTRCIGPDPQGGVCGEFEVMRQSTGQDLESLGANRFSEVMSPDGEQLVVTNYEADGMHLFTADGEEEIEFLGRAAAISDDGEVLAVTRYPDTQATAGRWTRENGFEALGDIPDGTGVSFATDMSADGSVIVGYAQIAAGEVPFIWRDGALEALTDLPGDATTARPLRVSDDGSTLVGITIESSGQFRPVDVFRWTESEGFSVVAPACAAYTLCLEAWKLRVNEDGSAIAGTRPYGDDTSGAVSAFRWTESEGLVYLGPDAEPYPSTVLDMNADGSVIVGQMDASQGYGRAYLWDEASGLEPLSERLEAADVDLTGWNLADGEVQVSADGKVVVGVGSCGGTRALYRAVLSED